MLHKNLLLALLLLPLGIIAQNFGGNPAGIRWQQINTAQSRVIFPKGLDSQARRISSLLTRLDSSTLRTIGPAQRKWNVVLLNQNTDANAYVRLAPVLSELYMVPPQDNFSNGSLRWDDNLVIHEDRHMQQFANFNHGLTKVFAFFLGQEGQLLANGITIPNYFFEGDAVWQETLVSGQGRGRLPAFYNGIKSLWLDQKQYSWMKLRSGSLRDYTPDHYELGYPLVAYGYAQYGAEFWKKVTSDAVRFKGLFYAFDKAIERHAGVSYPQFRHAALEYYKAQTIQTAATAALQYLTPLEPHTVSDYLFPQFVSDDTIIVTKQSYRAINSFYLLVNGKEQKLRVKDYVTDDYFSYKNGKVVYAAYQSDPRWGNRNYSVLQLLDIYTNQQRQLTRGSMYFSPDINSDGTAVIAVKVNEDGSNFLQQLDAATGAVLQQVPNPNNYFFTQTKYIDASTVVSAVRDSSGQMALLKVNVQSGATEMLLPFSRTVLGYPQVHNGKVYFCMAEPGTASLSAADRIFSIDLNSKQVQRLTDNINGVYHPAINSKGTLVFAAFTADGYRLASTTAQPAAVGSIAALREPAVESSIATGAIIESFRATNRNSTPYKRSFQLFNFHSARPYVSDPEFGYEFYSDNILSSFYNVVRYVYNRNDQSHAIGYDAVFAGWFPFLRLGGEYGFNHRNVTVQGNPLQYNSVKLNAGVNVPFSIIRGKTFKYLNVGGGYNIERIYFTGASKDLYADQDLQYLNGFFSFSNISRTARQHINPRWAQTVSVNYRDATTLYNSHKLVGRTSLYFPGIAPTNSLVIDAAIQHRDTLRGDLFSNNFPYSRGYQALSERTQWKLGANYHFPLWYPDWGVGNIVFIQRIRVNAFYDHTRVMARLRNGNRFDFNNRSTGAEMFFDTKVWNSLPVTLGVRYSRLLDTDYQNRGAVNRWEIVLPVNLIPN